MAGVVARGRSPHLLSVEAMVTTRTGRQKGVAHWHTGQRIPRGLRGPNGLWIAGKGMRPHSVVAVTIYRYETSIRNCLTAALEMST